MVEVVTLGEAVVEVMRPRDGVGLEEEGTFFGPYPSGAPAIFADAVAQMGHDAGFVGAVGDDAFGSCLSKRLSADGVDTSHLLARSSDTTGVAFVTYHGDDREFLYHIADTAADTLTPETVPRDFVGEATVLHLNGSSLAVSDQMRTACNRALTVAADNDVMISLDPNLRAELLDEVPADLLEVALSNCDVVVPTAAEAKSVAGADDTDAAVQWFLDQGCDLVALKQGAEGCTLYTETEMVSVDAIDVAEVDPTGAGDAFGAGVVTAILEDRPLRETGRFATVIGALSVTEKGPMEGIPSRERVDSIFESAYE